MKSTPIRCLARTAPALASVLLVPACGGGAGPVLASADGKYEVLFSAEAMWKQDRARQEMESALERLPEIDLVYAHNDDMAYGAQTAASQKRRADQMSFVSIDALPKVGRRYLIQSVIDATIEYPTCAYAAVDLALLLCNGVTLPDESRRLLLGTRVWTRDNLADGGQPIPSPGDIALASLRRQYDDILTTDPETDEVWRIGMAQCTDDEPWRQAMREDLLAAAELYPQVTLDYRAADDDNEKQRGIVREFIAQGYNAILVSPKEKNALVQACKEAREAGIHVVVIDRELGSDDFSVFVGGDNHAIGRAAGEQIKQLLPEGGKIVELRGLMTSSPAVERHRGFVEALALEPK